VYSSLSQLHISTLQGHCAGWRHQKKQVLFAEACTVLRRNKKTKGILFVKTCHSIQSVLHKLGKHCETSRYPFACRVSKTGTARLPLGVTPTWIDIRIAVQIFIAVSLNAQTSTEKADKQKHDVMCQLDQSNGATFDADSRFHLHLPKRNKHQHMLKSNGSKVNRTKTVEWVSINLFQHDRIFWFTLGKHSINTKTKRCPNFGYPRITMTHGVEWDTVHCIFRVN